MPSPTRLLLLGSLLFTVASAACATEVGSEDDDEEVFDDSEAALTNKSVPLKYEGTCDFLRSCSRWSRGLPEGNVLWGCSAENTSSSDGRHYGACEDDELWVAGPTRAYCGKTVEICKSGTCVEAKVKDISVSRDWEASNGVLTALDISFGLTGQCGGYGGGRVTITTL